MEKFLDKKQFLEDELKTEFGPKDGLIWVADYFDVKNTVLTDEKVDWVTDMINDMDELFVDLKEKYHRFIELFNNYDLKWYKIPEDSVWEFNNRFKSIMDLYLRLYIAYKKIKNINNKTIETVFCAFSPYLAEWLHDINTLLSSKPIIYVDYVEAVEWGDFEDTGFLDTPVGRRAKKWFDGVVEKTKDIPVEKYLKEFREKWHPDVKMLKKYITDDLESWQRTMVKEHLGRCETCTDIVQGMLKKANKS